MFNWQVLQISLIRAVAAFWYNFFENVWSFCQNVCQFLIFCTIELNVSKTSNEQFTWLLWPMTVIQVRMHNFWLAIHREQPVTVRQTFNPFARKCEVRLVLSYWSLFTLVLRGVDPFTIICFSKYETVILENWLILSER